ncbi:hypothetical protein KNP414_05048 [Paenibacillus mucilaginosus KNP414]|uniref:Uncharacterized protein n=1 Tax=Paenibacillus mucilaginosus (strain KNP414) TaxID=1036673 RepID=F8F6Q6_PAEMK|nr:hypothetical protein KNP414_05048 [Paenibacillus mucilaginosus KNP414]
MNASLIHSQASGFGRVHLPILFESGTKNHAIGKPTAWFLVGFSTYGCLEHLRPGRKVRSS